MNSNLTEYEQLHIENLRKGYSNKKFILKMIIPSLIIISLYFFRSSPFFIVLLVLVLLNHFGLCWMLNKVANFTDNLILKLVSSVDKTTRKIEGKE
jgi:hypothetical protein